MSLNPEEDALFRAAINQIPNIKELEFQTKLDLLQEAPHVRFCDLEGLFDARFIIETDEADFHIQLQPWLEETKPQPGEPILGQVTQIFGNQNTQLKVGRLIIIDGAAIEHTMRPEDKGTIAQNCNLSFRSAKVERVELPPNPDDALKELKRIEAQRSSGWVRAINGVDYRLIPGATSSFTPIVRHAMYGIMETPIFHNSAPEV